MNADPWDVIVQLYLGGDSASSFHRRTVASLEADTTKDGLGKITPRTCESLSL